MFLNLLNSKKYTDCAQHADKIISPSRLTCVTMAVILPAFTMLTVLPADIVAASVTEKASAAEDGATKKTAAEDDTAKKTAAEDNAAKKTAAEDNAAKKTAAEDNATKKTAAKDNSASKTSTEAKDSSESTGTKVPEVTLRVGNWEEYVDLGDWGEDEVIDLESGDIFGENSVVEDFEDWYLETYGIKVNVEYCTFGTNEDMYNMLTLGETYDVVCPSEYMFMKLIAEDRAVPLSDAFFDTSDPNNYYINGVSPYIENIFKSNAVDGKVWADYAAGYMWGITGWVYNPDKISEEDVSTWRLMENSNYARQITVKDNVRDTYFATVGAIKSDLLTSDDFISDPDYEENLKSEMNDTSSETRDMVLDYLQSNLKNFYSLETDSGKADMITGKVVANLQWSGDAVYTMDQAEEDDYDLCFAVPEEVTNIYFDGWIMLKCGIKDNEMKQHAAEAWINFCSRPDIVIRNMYYIGYTSCIAGGDDNRIFEYLDWNYGAEEDEEDITDYNVSYFFTGEFDDDPDYTLTVPTEQLKRQLGAQYPSAEVISRSSIMMYFDTEVNQAVNQMWIGVRCFNIKRVPVVVWVLVAAAVVTAIVFYVKNKKTKKYD